MFSQLKTALLTWLNRAKLRVEKLRSSIAKKWRRLVVKLLRLTGRKRQNDAQALAEDLQAQQDEGTEPKKNYRLILLRGLLIAELIAAVLYKAIPGTDLVSFATFWLVGALIIITLKISEVFNFPWSVNFVKWSIGFRIFGSLAGGFFAAFLLKMAVNAFLFLTPSTTNLWDGNLYFIISLVFTGLFAMARPEERWQADGKPHELIVPPTKFAAQLLWFGIPVPILLESSKYPWIGKNLGFSVSHKVVETFTDANGFLRMGDVQFRVWNEAEAPAQSPQRSRVTAPAKNEADIAVALTLIVRIVDPRKLLDSADPALDLGDRARQEWRELVTRFVDTDVPKLHSVLGRLFEGYPLVTSFIGEPVQGHKAGSMVRNKSDEVMYKRVVYTDKAKTQKVDLTDEFKLKQEIELVDNDLQDEIAQKANWSMLKKVAKHQPQPEDDDDGNEAKPIKVQRSDEADSGVWTTDVRIHNPITEVLDAIGCRLERVSIADIQFSKQVQTAAGEAAAEQNQRRAQLQSAETITAVREKFLPSTDIEKQADPAAFELASILAASQDDDTGNIRVVKVLGSGKDDKDNDSLSKSVVAAASLSSENSN